MVEPTDGATRDLKAFLDGKADASISNNDVSSLGEGWDDGRDCSERLGVENSGFRPKEIRNAVFKLSVNVNRPIETGWTAASETVLP